MVNTSSSVSLYKQVKEEMMKNISSKAWALGEKIPSENKLCAMYGVSRITVRQAISELTQEGYLETKRGAGTFVILPNLQTENSDVYSIKNEIKKRGYHSWFKIISFQLEEADEEAQRRLHLQQGDKVYTMERLIYADETPLAFEINIMPEKLFPGLERQDIEDRGTLYGAFKEKYRCVPTEAKEALSAVLADEKIAGLLKVEMPYATLVIRRVTKQLEEYIEYSMCYLRGDLFWYGAKLKQI